MSDEYDKDLDPAFLEKLEAIDDNDDVQNMFVALAG